jgi:hypothetical protein
LPIFIDLDNRHRAGGDADYGNLVYSIISLGYYKGNGCNDQENIARSAITSNLPRTLNNCQKKPGVYYFLMNLKK